MQKKSIVEIDTEGKVSVYDDLEIVKYDHIPVGAYGVVTIASMFSKQQYLVTKAVKIPNSSETIVGQHVDMNEIDKYFSEKSIAAHNDLGVINNLGYLYYGIQGSGKTTTMLSIADKLQKKMNARTFICSGLEDLIYIFKTVTLLREKCGEFLCVVVWDECEKDMEDYEGHVKSYMDGSDSINNVIFLAATNYLEKIPRTIRDRKSRFKYVIDVSGIDNEIVINEILHGMNSTLRNKISDVAIKRIVPQLKGSTVDDIKHKFLETVIFNS